MYTLYKPFRLILSRQLNKTINFVTGQLDEEETDTAILSYNLFSQKVKLINLGLNKANFTDSTMKYFIMNGENQSTLRLVSSPDFVVMALPPDANVISSHLPHPYLNLYGYFSETDEVRKCEKFDISNLISPQNNNIIIIDSMDPESIKGIEIKPETIIIYIPKHGGPLSNSKYFLYWSQGDTYRIKGFPTAGNELIFGKKSVSITDRYLVGKRTVIDLFSGIRYMFPYPVRMVSSDHVAYGDFIMFLGNPKTSYKVTTNSFLDFSGSIEGTIYVNESRDRISLTEFEDSIELTVIMNLLEGTAIENDDSWVSSEGRHFCVARSDEIEIYDGLTGKLIKHADNPNGLFV